MKSLASKPQVLENCPFLGSRTALFFESLKFCWKTPETSRKICEYLFCFPQLEHRRSQRGGSDGTQPSIEILPMTKICQKSLLFLQFQFSIFLLATVTNNNMEDQGPRAPFNSIFASQFKRITRRKWSVFVLKVAISDPHIAFL